MGKIFGGCLGIIIAAVLIDMFVAWVIMTLWNFAMPSIWPGAPVLEFWKTFCLLIIFNLIIGVFKK